MSEQLMCLLPLKDHARSAVYATPQTVAMAAHRPYLLLLQG